METNEANENKSLSDLDTLIQKINAELKPKHHQKVGEILRFLDKHSERILQKSNENDITAVNIIKYASKLEQEPSETTLDSLLIYVREYYSKNSLRYSNWG